MPEDRRLAAIMFTVIVGYTAMFGTDAEILAGKNHLILRFNQELQRKPNQ